MEAIIAAPDDDSHRLVFADWLDDHDQPERAELIRAQCALAGMEGDDPRRPELTQREEELLLHHEAEWRKEVPAWVAKYAQFRRGFVAHVGTGVKTFIGK